jgi:putative ABC transport system ATP-binding protein
VIEIKNVTKTYGKKQAIFTALDNINFTIPDGASVAIVGKSGSGKSTLMHVMSGLDRPNTGEVVIDGQDILTLNSRRIDQFRAHSIGFIFQAFFVQANDSCYQNVALPLEIAGVPLNERRRLVEAALEEVELMEKINSKAGSLSGGQKQRLAIARAIVNKPKILFADEPTGNLDSATGERIEDLLFSLNRSRGTTLVIVTHDEDLAARCEYRLNVKDGRASALQGVSV